MRLPHSVDEKVTKATKKKPLEAVSIFSDAGTILEEFGITESGNVIQCYVQVSPGDFITLGYEIPCTEGQIVDFFIDGVLRESNIATSRPLTIHRGKITKVCACEIRPSGAKGKLEYCDMMIEDRKTPEDIYLSASGFNDLQPSAVGTIEVRVLRDINLGARSHKEVKPEQADRGPTFENNLRWWDVSKRVDSGIIAPTYQIGFINGRKTHGNSRKNINRSIEGYYLWASFKFLYRSASDIQAAGFDTIDNPLNSSSNNKADRSSNLTDNMASTKSAAAITTDSESFLSQMALSELSSKQVDLDNTENTGQVEPAKKKLQIGASAKSTQVLDSIAVVIDSDQEGSEIAGNQRSYKAYCETECSEDDTDKRQEPSQNEAPIANRKKAEHDRPNEVKKSSKQKPLPAWSRKAATGATEQAIMSGATSSAMATKLSEQSVENHDIQPKMFQSKESQGDFEVEPIGHRSRIGNLSEPFLKGSQQEYDRSLPSLAEKPLQLFHLQDSSSPIPVPTSSSYVAGAGAAIQGPGIDQEIGVAPLQRIANFQPATPNTMMRAKAGHYMSRSPLVDPDPEDIERHAKAMTNGKGDWRGRVTQMLQVLSAPPKNCTLTEGFPSSIAPEVLATQDLAAASLPNSASDTPTKRKFGEFNVGTHNALRPQIGRPSLVANLNGLGISPKAHREELARKKRAKLEALEKAKAEADALRRQVEEFEAGQAEAIAQEESELEELDMELENIQGEAQALSARLRELHEQ